MHYSMQLGTGMMSGIENNVQYKMKITGLISIRNGLHFRRDIVKFYFKWVRIMLLRDGPGVVV